MMRVDLTVGGADLSEVEFEVEVEGIGSSTARLRVMQNSASVTADDSKPWNL